MKKSELKQIIKGIIHERENIPKVPGSGIGDRPPTKPTDAFFNASTSDTSMGMKNPKKQQQIGGDSWFEGYDCRPGHVDGGARCVQAQQWTGEPPTQQTGEFGTYAECVNSGCEDENPNPPQPCCSEFPGTVYMRMQEGYAPGGLPDAPGACYGCSGLPKDPDYLDFLNNFELSTQWNYSAQWGDQAGTAFASGEAACPGGQSVIILGYETNLPVWNNQYDMGDPAGDWNLGQVSGCTDPSNWTENPWFTGAPWESVNNKGKKIIESKKPKRKIKKESKKMKKSELRKLIREVIQEQFGSAGRPGGDTSFCANITPQNIKQVAAGIPKATKMKIINAKMGGLSVEDQKAAFRDMISQIPAEYRHIAKVPANLMEQIAPTRGDRPRPGGDKAIHWLIVFAVFMLFWCLEPEGGY